MRWTQSLIPTLKETPSEAEIVSHQLMIRAGLIRKLASGVYSYLPLGWRVLQKVEEIIREEMNAKGAQEILLPALQPRELWDKSGRYEVIKDIMVWFKDRHGRELILGPTHEEVITDLVGSNVKSYRELPFILYQIQNKFRDEPRPRFGVLRSCEFIMKDAYSFDTSWEGLDINYKKMYDAYGRIFERCGLKYTAVEADPGMMGGDVSHEFMVLTPNGEDSVVVCKSCGYAGSSDKTEIKESPTVCPKCKKKVTTEAAIEVGHIFKLGTKYSQSLGAVYLDKEGKEQPIIMGCYGIGVNRIIASAIEQNNDQDGIIWPKSISPFQVIVIPLNIGHEKSANCANKIYEQLSESGVEVLLDDRDERAGVKFKDADLIGIPLRVVIGEKKIAEGKIELSERGKKESRDITVGEVEKQIRKELERV